MSEYEGKIHVIVDDMPKPPTPTDYKLTTTVKSYIVDAAGVTGPTSIELCGYDPSRDCVRIQTIDAAVIVSQDPPANAPVTSSATVAPTGQSMHVINNAAYHAEIYGDQPLWLISVTGQTSTRVSVAITRRVRI